MKEKTFLDILLSFQKSEEEFLKNHFTVGRISKIRRILFRATLCVFPLMIVVSVCYMVLHSYNILAPSFGGLILVMIVMGFLTILLYLSLRLPSISISRLNEKTEALKESKEYLEEVVAPLWRELSRYVNLVDHDAIVKKCKHVHENEPIQEFVCFQRLLFKIGVEVTLEHPTRQNPIVQHIFSCGDAQTFYEAEMTFEY